MKSCRIHITGASGSGVTSLGRALADSLAMPHHDTDDYLWRPTIPPYRETRNYVRRVMELYGRPTHPYDKRIAAPSHIVTR